MISVQTQGTNDVSQAFGLQVSSLVHDLYLFNFFGLQKPTLFWFLSNSDHPVFVSFLGFSSISCPLTIGITSPNSILGFLVFHSINLLISMQKTPKSTVLHHSFYVKCSLVFSSISIFCINIFQLNQTQDFQNLANTLPPPLPHICILSKVFFFSFTKFKFPKSLYDSIDYLVFTSCQIFL